MSMLLGGAEKMLPTSSVMIAMGLKVLVIPRYAVTACETDHYILVVFVVMSKEERSMYRRKASCTNGTSQTVLKRSNRK